MSKFIYNICKFFRLPCFKKKNKIGILETKNLKESFQKSKKISQININKSTISDSSSVNSSDTLLHHYEKYDSIKNSIPYPLVNNSMCITNQHNYNKNHHENKENDLSTHEDYFFNDVFISDTDTFEDKIKVCNNIESLKKEQKWIEYAINRKYNYKWLKKNTKFDYNTQKY